MNWSEKNINKESMLSVGTILMSVYRIDSYLSSGGFGNTYVATNMVFDEVVAIKEFFMRGVTERDANNTTVSVSNTDNKALFEEQKEKFKKEARRLRKLNNPHIVRVHDLFEENGTAYYVMDYIEGENLNEKLKRLQKPLSEDEVMKYMPQILDALECVHQEELCHLDLKPANIMVDKQGKVTLIDFGASKQCSNAGKSATITAVSYTNGFAPLEQMEQNIEKIGPWTDFYALGATIYNLLVNKKPQPPSDIDDDLSKDKHLALPFPSNISEKTKGIILMLMETDRAERPQSVQEVRKLIDCSDKGLGETADVKKEANKEEDTLVLAKRKEDNKTSPLVEKVKDTKRNSQFRAKIGLPLLAAAIIIVTAILIVLSYNNKGEEKSNDIIVQSETGNESDGLQPAKLSVMSEFETLLENCSYDREQICDNNYYVCYYLSYPSFLKKELSNEGSNFRNLFSDDRYMTIETWVLWNHLEAEYGSNDVYNQLKSRTDTYHKVKNNMVVVTGIYDNGKKYYTKAIFDDLDNVIFCRITYSDELSRKTEDKLIQRVFNNFPN